MVGQKWKNAVGVWENKRSARNSGVKREAEDEKLVWFVNAMAEVVSSFTKRSGSAESSAEVQNFIHEEVSNATRDLTHRMGEFTELIN